MIYYSCITYTKLHIHGKQNVWPGQMTSNSNQKKSAICPCPRFPAFHSLLVDLCAQRAAQRLVQYVFLHVIQPTQTIHFLRSLATSLGWNPVDFLYFNVMFLGMLLLLQIVANLCCCEKPSPFGALINNPLPIQRSLGPQWRTEWMAFLLFRFPSVLLFPKVMSGKRRWIRNSM